jgi:hypothetical protein
MKTDGEQYSNVDKTPPWFMASSLLDDIVHLAIL